MRLGDVKSCPSACAQAACPVDCTSRRSDGLHSGALTAEAWGLGCLEGLQHHLWPRRSRSDHFVASRGIQQRERAVHQPPAHGGQPCSGAPEVAFIGVAISTLILEAFKLRLCLLFQDIKMFLSCYQEHLYRSLMAGDLLDSQQCVERPCPTDCVLQQWSDWEDCSSSCGSGVHKRSRTSTPAMYGGQAARTQRKYDRSLYLV